MTILTVTPNPAVDLTYTVDRLQAGSTTRADAARLRAGGKGLNVARVARQLGHDVLAIAPVGGPLGERFAEELASSGLPHLLIPVAGATRRSIAVVETGAGRTSVLNELGTRLSPQEWAELNTAVRSQLGRAGCLVGSGSLPPAAPQRFYAELVTAGKSAGIPVVIDAAGEALILAARAGADLLKPNRDELAEATGYADPVRGARVLLAAGAGLVLVSLGEAGMIAVTATDTAVLAARLPEPLPGNPTGAGDAAVAAAALRLAAGVTDPAEILRFAVACSAGAVLAPVAGEVAGDLAQLEAAVVVTRKPMDDIR